MEVSNLEHARKLAKELLKEVRAGDPVAVGRLRRLREKPCLADAQFAIADENWFENWPHLARVLEGRQLRTVQPLRRAAERLLDAFIDLHRVALIDGPEYSTWQDLAIFAAVEAAAAELEVSIGHAQGDDPLLAVAVSAVAAFRQLHMVGRADPDGEYYEALDDAMIDLGAVFGRFHTRP